ncbi:pimeloyl-ACP methyl ester carboxylesterase [Streptacidiphilus sp. MAP12-33]|uniref:alpha/beta fold hydrolase n=1 Tax=Streptacidiphilus sp. MAP12-33 TaxID=3156266 RepID=UPI003511CCE3
MRLGDKATKRTRRVGVVAAAALTVVGLCAGGPAVAASRAAAQDGPAGILGVPTQVAHTRLGDVGYRELGAGSPIVLVMGHGGSMDDWAPDFVDALAAHHRVVVFDNAGIGETSALPAPLTVSEMADQTAALLASLRLHRPTVLGWSMGGMIAQALAVRHPERVGRLVLAATLPGTGDALPVPAAAAAALDSPNPLVALSVLFPQDQTAAMVAYGRAVLQYPDFYSASAAVRTEQRAASTAWTAGQDPAGRHIGRIHVPVLVADGAEDAVNPPSNASLLAADLRRAQLLQYPDAGHAFLFQDAPAFVAAVDAFAR